MWLQPRKAPVSLCQTTWWPQTKYPTGGGLGMVLRVANGPLANFDTSCGCLWSYFLHPRGNTIPTVWLVAHRFFCSVCATHLLFGWPLSLECWGYPAVLTEWELIRQHSVYQKMLVIHNIITLWGDASWEVSIYTTSNNFIITDRGLGLIKSELMKKYVTTFQNIYDLFSRSWLQLTRWWRTKQQP
jgi:hypothetical protein